MADRDLRAFTYYRVAELMHGHNDPQKLPLYYCAVACFRRGLSLSSHPQRANAGRAPCVIFLPGADAFLEQNFFRGVQWLTSLPTASVNHSVGPGLASANARSCRVSHS